MNRESLHISHLHKVPHRGVQLSNNRKWTWGRVVIAPKVQSIPIFGIVDDYGFVKTVTSMRDISMVFNKPTFLGYKYIKHY